MPSLLLLLVFTLLLIGILQFALIKLPTIQGRFTLRNLKDVKDSVENALDRRVDSVEYGSQRAEQAPAATSEMIHTEPPRRLKVRQEPVSETTVSSDQTTSPTETIASSATESDYVSEEVTLTSTTAPSVYVPDEATLTRTTAPSVYLPADATITSSSEPGATPPGAYVPPDVTLTRTAGSVYVSGDETLTLSSAARSIYVSGDETLTLSSAATSVYVSAGMTITKTYSDASTDDPSSTGEPTTAATSGDYVADEETTSTGVVVLRWTPTKVFLSTYLAVLLAVIYRIFIGTVQTQVCLIDPFRHLSSPKGAPASTALFTSYHSQALLGPLVALGNGRFALFAIGFASWISCLLPAFASEAIFVDTNWSCPDPRVGRPNPCPPRTTAAVSVVRLLQCLLAFIAVVLIVLFFALRRKTGLEEDPSSIAAVARLMGHPSFEHDLRNMPSGTGTTISMMKQEMGRNRYRLEAWFEQYGIVPAVIADNTERGTAQLAHQSTVVDWSGTSAMYRPVDPRSSSHKDDDGPHRWRRNDYVLLFMVAGVFGVVLAYYLVGGDNGFNNFFNSSTFGPRFILTGSATIIANIWGCVQEDSMVMAPFTRLANGSASFDTLIFNPTITPILSTWRAMSNGYGFAGTVTIMTLLAEVLSIAIAGVPFAPGQLFLNFLVVAYMSLAILGIMLLAAIAVIVHRKYEPRIPVVPDTLGPKMSYLVGSKMLENFDSNAGTCGENSLRSGRYGFRPVTESNGGRWWKIDQLVRQDGVY